MTRITLLTGIFAALIAHTVACAGPQGPQGPAGKDGVNGADGATGAAGAAGANGQDGAPGANGQDGAPGAPGLDAPVDQVTLPGPSYFPESINAASDGTLFVTSIGTGEVVKVAPDRRTVTEFIAPEGVQPKGKTGMLIDEVNDNFWVCTVATDFSVASELRRYTLSTGALQQTIALTSDGICNDIAVDDAGTLYITDSFIGIERLPGGAVALEQWVTDPLLQPVHQGAFAVDGIVKDGDDFFVDNLDTGAIVRVHLNADGSAGTPVAIAGVTLTAPDGIRLLAHGKILAAESSADTLSEIDVANDAGTRTILSNRLDRPSAVAIVGDDAWVSDGQVFRLFGLDSTTTHIPFLVERVPVQ